MTHKCIICGDEEISFSCPTPNCEYQSCPDCIESFVETGDMHCPCCKTPLAREVFTPKIGEKGMGQPWMPR